MSMQRNYGDLFSSLFKTETTSDKVLFKIGSVSGLLLGVASVMAVTAQYWDGTKLKLFVAVLVISLIVFFISFTLLAIRQIGRAAGKSNYLSQSTYFFKRLFLVLFLPCVLITVLILLWAYWTHQPIFQ